MGEGFLGADLLRRDTKGVNRCHLPLSVDPSSGIDMKLSGGGSWFRRKSTRSPITWRLSIFMACSWRTSSSVPFQTALRSGYRKNSSSRLEEDLALKSARLRADPEWDADLALADVHDESDTGGLVIDVIVGNSVRAVTSPDVVLDAASCSVASTFSCRRLDDLHSLAASVMGGTSEIM